MKAAIPIIVLVGLGLFGPFATVHATDPDDREWSLVLVELAPGDMDARHFHPGLELMYVLEGEGFLEVDGEPARALNPGTVAALPQDRRHVLKNTSATGSLKVLVVFFLDKEPKRFALHGQSAPDLEQGRG